MIRYADLYAEYLECQEVVDAAMQRCIINSSFINGPEVLSFEQEWATYCKAEACAGVSSGTSALMLALDSLGIGPGDEVIVPAMSFISTAEVINQLGATPVFVDIDLDHVMDIDQVHVSDKTRAVIFVDLYGQTLDIAKLKCRIGDIPLIRDAAQSAGVRYLPGGDHDMCYATCWSFYPGKNLSAMGDAGAVTGSEEVCAKIRYLRDHGRTEKYVHTGRGWNERLDGLQAAILRAKLPYLETWNERRQRNAALYRGMLQHRYITLPQEKKNISSHVYNQFVIKTQNRDDLRNFLAERGIETGLQFPLALHQQPVYKHLNLIRPMASILADRCLSLPVHAQMSVQQVITVGEAVMEFINRKGSGDIVAASPIGMSS